MQLRDRRSILERLLTAGLALLALSLGGGARAAEPDAALMESLGMYVASLLRNLDRARDLRGLAAPTEDQAGALDLSIRDAQLIRAHLRTRGRALPPASDQAQALQRFLDRWSDDRIAEGLRAAPRHSALDPAVRELARVFPEKRHFSPPFRLFRP